MGIHTYGSMGVDWEERVRFDRLREERLARIKAQLEASELGALLCFDMTNIRYVTATHIGTWAQDKINRFCLLPRGDDPIMWDFGSAARHHQLYNPWLGDGRSRAGISTMRGAFRRFWEVVGESRALQSRARELTDHLEQAIARAMARTDVPEPELTAALVVAAYRTVHLHSVRRILSGDDAEHVAADHRKRIITALAVVDQKTQAAI